MVSPQLGSKGPTLSEAGSKLSSATPFGSLNTSKIELTFEADCEDEGVYSCCEEIAGADLDCTGSKSLQVEVFADKVELAPVNLFDSVLVLRCLAKIGRGKNVSFAWQYKDKEDDFQDYTGKRTETMKRKPDSNFQCQDKQDSLMAPGQVREGRLYRCYVNISGAEKPVYSNVYYKEVERAEEKEEQQKQEQEPEQERQEMKASGPHTVTITFTPRKLILSEKKQLQALQIGCLTSAKPQNMVINYGAFSDETRKELVFASRYGLHVFDFARKFPQVKFAGGIPSRWLRISFQADCRHKGVYSCCAHFNGTNTCSNKEVEFELSLGKVRMRVTPRTSAHPVNSQLELVCRLGVGRMDTNVTWVWEYKDPGDDVRKVNRKQISYTSIGRDGRFPCQFNQESGLTRNVTVRDLGRQYRCYASVGAEKSPSYEKTLSYEVLPGAVELSAKLPGQNLQGDNTVVLSCVGKVGHNSSLIKWIWQYKEPAQDHFRDLEDNAKVAADQSAEDSSFPCQQEQRISLTLKASEELEGRTYRCFIRKSGLPEKPLQYGQYRFPGIDITFLPGKPRLSEFKTTMRFRINCSRDLPNLESLEIIRGDSNLSNSDKVVVASAAGTNLLNYGIVNFPEARHSGGVKSGWITMDFKASCPTHEGMYACCASWTDNNLKSRQSKCLQKQLEFDLPFGEVTLTPSPSGRTHGLNSILVLRCAAKIGRSDENVTWVWQYKDATDGGYRDFAATSRISTKSSARTPGFECQWRQNSVLTLRVTQADLTGRAYRCFVRRNGLPVEPTQAGVYTFPKIVKNGQPKSGSVDEDVKGGSEDSGSGSGDTKGNGGVDGDPDADDSGGGRDDGVLTVGTSQKGRAAAVEGKD
nr:hypothetical protein BaRGS_021993 [Batillaria attramentaria]